MRLMPAGDFAKLSRTSKAALYHYDNVGVLPPATRGRNNYRYYSSVQLAVVNVIRIFQELGMSLDEIKEIKDRRSPEFLDILYADQIEQVDRKIDDWVRARKLLQTMREIIHSTKDIDEKAVTVQSLPSIAVIRGDLNDYSGGRDAYNALLSFYQTMYRRYPGLDLNYPVWGIISENRMRRGDWVFPDHYYFYNPAGYDRRPAAQYAVGYARGGYGQTDELYGRLLRYIAENDYEICGDTYEEYPLNEMSVSETEGYLIRALITVRSKKVK